MAFTAGGRFNFITAKGETSVQEEHFHSVYFAAGTARASLPRQGVRRRCPQRAILAGGHLNHSLRGLKTRAPRKLVANKQCCSRDEQDVLVSKLVIDVTGFSRPEVAAFRYSHTDINFWKRK